MIPFAAAAASDADAAVYYLARMIESGESVNFISRRMVIFAAEDVGLADPHALSVAITAQQAADFVGHPEARLPLTQAVLYLSLAPKSTLTFSKSRESSSKRKGSEITTFFTSFWPASRPTRKDPCF